MSNKTVLDCDTGIVSVVPRTDADIAEAQRTETQTTQRNQRTRTSTGGMGGGRTGGGY